MRVKSQKEALGFPQNHFPLSIAPMMDITDRHFRFLLRLMSPHLQLYTEMISGSAILHGDTKHLLGYSPQEHPLVLQLGEGKAEVAKIAVEMANEWEYQEINLNAGCPSDKVQKGNFGAALMCEPEHCAQIYSAMQKVSSVPVSVKCRIGISSPKLGIDKQRYEDLRAFVETLADAGCRKFIVHARIAILEGLSTKENREIPPLRYEDIYRLKQEFPEFHIGINGGINTPEAMKEHLKYVDEVMIGRAICDNPALLYDFHSAFELESPLPKRDAVVAAYIDYLDMYLGQEPRRDSVRFLIQPLMDLYSGLAGVRYWRRALSPGQLPRESKLLVDYLRKLLEQKISTEKERNDK